MKSNQSKKIKNRQGQVRDYSNDPYFIKKANQSKIFLEKQGFSAELMQKKTASTETAIIFREPILLKVGNRLVFWHQ